MKPTAVIDSSPLINLVHLQIAENLQFYFHAVYVPRMVQKEVNRKFRFRYKLNKLYSKGVFQRCVVGDPVSVQLLLQLDAGEAEALVQASEQGATVFIGDENNARRISELRGVRPIGTARLLARMNLEGYADDPRHLARRLQRECNYWITDEILNVAIKRAHEPI